MYYSACCCPYFLCNFEPSEALKQANSSLNATWNTTKSKAASFCLFSLCLLSTNLPYTSYKSSSSSASTSPICTHVLRVLQFTVKPVIMDPPRSGQRSLCFTYSSVRIHDKEQIAIWSEPASRFHRRLRRATPVYKYIEKSSLT